MRYLDDDRIVMTLDAGGTNFVFSAVQSEKENRKTHILPANGDALEIVLQYHYQRI